MARVRYIALSANNLKALLITHWSIRSAPSNSATELTLIMLNIGFHLCFLFIFHLHFYRKLLICNVLTSLKKIQLEPPTSLTEN